jgi:hypothetical protein
MGLWTGCSHLRPLASVGESGYTLRALVKMAAKEIRIDGRRFEVYDWRELRDDSPKSPGKGIPSVGTFRVTLTTAPPVGATVAIDGDDYGIIESIGPPDQHVFALGSFLVRGSLFPKGASATPEAGC